jgi:hypothetical protein
MFGVPIYVYFFLFAGIAVLAARWSAGEVGDDAGSFPAIVLYAVAAGFALAGLAGAWLGHAAF